MESGVIPCPPRTSHAPRAPIASPWAGGWKRCLGILGVGPRPPPSQFMQRTRWMNPRILFPYPQYLGSRPLSCVRSPPEGPAAAAGAGPGLSGWSGDRWTRPGLRPPRAVASPRQSSRCSPARVPLFRSVSSSPPERWRLPPALCSFKSV